MEESNIFLQDIMSTQSAIGWNLLQFGFVAVAWKKTQHDWAKHRDPNYSHKRSKRWARQLQESLWEYVSAIWDHRNKVVHGKDQQEIISKKLPLLRCEVKEVIWNPPALGAGNRHLLLIENIDEKREQNLHH